MHKLIIALASLAILAAAGLRADRWDSAPTSTEHVAKVGVARVLVEPATMEGEMPAGGTRS